MGRRSVSEVGRFSFVGIGFSVCCGEGGRVGVDGVLVKDSAALQAVVSNTRPSRIWNGFLGGFMIK